MEKKILVVDDEEDIRTLLTTSFESQGYQIISAADGTQGWEMLKNHKPDLLITDINMPGIDGIELLKKVREDSDLKDMPVIMLTGKSADEEILSGLSHGADHYITKPFTIKTVLNTVKMMLG